jgi:hypothetical protein
VESTQSMIRIVGLSATLPNYRDVGRFLGVNAESGRSERKVVVAWEERQGELEGRPPQPLPRPLPPAHHSTPSRSLPSPALTRRHVLL